MKSLLASISFLTRIRIPGSHPNRETLKWSPLWFPIVGALTGYALALVYVYGLLRLWPRSVSAVLLLGFWLWLKDAFHLDGLTDLLDGLYGAADPEGVREIMKDSYLGPFGTMGLMIVLALEYVVVLKTDPSTLIGLMPVVVACSTGAAGLLLCWGRKLSSEGLAAFFVDGRRPWFSPVIVLTMFLVGGYCLRLPGVLLVLVALLLTLALSWVLNMWLGGINGDCCGAVTMVIQSVLLLLSQLNGLGSYFSVQQAVEFGW